jgi:hypothetical protein
MAQNLTNQCTFGSWNWISARTSLRTQKANLHPKAKDYFIRDKTYIWYIGLEFILFSTRDAKSHFNAHDNPGWPRSGRA